MSTPRSVLIGFLASVSLFAMTSFAGDHSPERARGRTLGPAGPPLSYHIEDVSIRITTYPGQSASKLIGRVSLAGTGEGMLEKDGNRLSFPYAQKNLLTHLNVLYGIRFFDLPVDYITQYRVFLKDDGTVETSALRMVDMSSTRICTAIGQYQKCVTYAVGQPPRELEEMVKQTYREVANVPSELFGKGE
jgi:hypothetical protein